MSEEVFLARRGLPQLESSGIVPIPAIAFPQRRYHRLRGSEKANDLILLFVKHDYGYRVTSVLSLSST